MKLFVVTILLVSIALSGCSNVRTYTFKKDRVDQTQEGNRGYIMGTPPPAPISGEVPKRTMFGVDIEVPILPGEKAMTSKKEVSYVEEREVIEEEMVPAMEEKTNFEPKKETQATESEEEWIK